MKLDGYDLKVFEEVEEFMITDYGIKKYPMTNEGYIEHDKLISMIEEMIWELKSLKDEKKKNWF